MRFYIEPLHTLLIDPYNEGVTFSREDLINYGHTLSNKPINIDHASIAHIHDKFKSSRHGRVLPYPDNRTLEIRYNSKIDGLAGEMEISDPNAISLILNGGYYNGIRMLSTESRRYGPWGKWLEFTYLTLLTPDFPPRDPRARILSVAPAGYW